MFILGEMISILLVWALMLAIFIPIGVVFQSFYLRNSKLNLIDAFWLGWGLVICILSFWNFFYPINVTTALLIFFIGMVSMLFKGREIFNFATSYSLKIVVFLLVVVWMTNRATAPILPYDAGLYHIQTIKWASACNIVPGIGNLHTRFAYNSSYFLYLALIKSFYAEFYKIGSGLLLVFALSQSLFSGIRVFKSIKKKNLYFHDIVAFVFFGPLLAQAFRYSATTSPDLPIFILGFILSVKLSEMIFEDLNSSQLSQRALFIILLALVGITIKLSFSVFGAALILAALYCVKHNNRLSRNKLLFFCLCAGILITFLLRGIILSGYPLYPSTLGAVKTSWQVSKARVVSDADWIKSWARMPWMTPGEVLGNWRWLDPWAKRMMQGVNIIDFLLPNIFTLFGVILISLLLIFQRIKLLEMLKLCLLIAPPCLGILFWFICAPDPRLAGASFFMVGASLAAIVFFSFSLYAQQIFFRVILFCGAFYVGIAFHETNAGIIIQKRDPNIIPVASLDQQITNSGLAVLTSKPGADQCWDASIPCAPCLEFDKNLELRDNNDICKGFRVKSTQGGH